MVIHYTMNPFHFSADNTIQELIADFEYYHFIKKTRGGIPMFMYHLGIVLMIWMGLGLISGLKGIFLDKTMDEEFVEEFREEHDIGDNDPRLDVLTNKKVNLAYSILLGPIGIAADLYGTCKYRNEEGEDEEQRGE